MAASQRTNGSANTVANTLVFLTVLGMLNLLIRMQAVHDVVFSQDYYYSSALKAVTATVSGGSDAFALPSLFGMDNSTAAATTDDDGENDKDNQSGNTVDKRPIIAICSCVISMKTWTDETATSLETLMIPSVLKTVTEEERTNFRFHLHLGMDQGDDFWERNVHRIKTPEWLEFHAHFYPKLGKIPFNPLLRDAYNVNAAYMVRINDDTEFTSNGWATYGVQALRDMEPPNVGVIGPFDPRNARMFTHDMVHRTHLDIFPVYYPEAFSNWWIDDWITSVYRPYRSKWVKHWQVKHHTVHGTRYKVDQKQKAHLKGEIDKGRERIKDWLVEQGYNATEKPFDPKLLDTRTDYRSANAIPKLFMHE